MVVMPGPRLCCAWRKGNVEARLVESSSQPSTPSRTTCRCYLCAACLGHRFLDQSAGPGGTNDWVSWGDAAAAIAVGVR